MADFSATTGIATRFCTVYLGKSVTLPSRSWYVEYLFFPSHTLGGDALEKVPTFFSTYWTTTPLRKEA